MFKKGIGSSILIFCLLLCLPLILDRWLASRLNRYNELALKYECYYDKTVCSADFNNDGITDRLSWEKIQYPAPDSDSWLIISDGTKELFRLPSQYINKTLRTHVAIRNTPEGAHLLVFDSVHAGKVAEPPNRIFAWNGQSMVPAPPSAIDEEIFSAMTAHDDAGTFSYWSVYTVFRWPLLLFYALLIVLAEWLYRRFRRPQMKLE